MVVLTLHHLRSACTPHRNEFNGVRAMHARGTEARIKIRPKIHLITAPMPSSRINCITASIFGTQQTSLDEKKKTITTEANSKHRSHSFIVSNFLPFVHMARWRDGAMVCAVAWRSESNGKHLRINRFHIAFITSIVQYNKQNSKYSLSLFLCTRTQILNLISAIQFGSQKAIKTIFIH